MHRRHLLLATLLLPCASRAQEVSEPWAKPLPEKSVLPNWPHLAKWRTSQTQRGLIEIGLERYADNGNSVPIKLSAKQSNHRIKELWLISERNPRREILQLDFHEALPALDFATRIRLVGTQNLIALVSLSNGDTYWQAAHISVTASACVEGA